MQSTNVSNNNSLSKNSNTQSYSNSSTLDDLPSEVKINILKLLNNKNDLIYFSFSNKKNLRFVEQNLWDKKLEKVVKVKALNTIETSNFQKDALLLGMFYQKVIQLMKYMPEVCSFLERELNLIAEGNTEGSITSSQRLNAMARALSKESSINPKSTNYLFEKILSVMEKMDQNHSTYDHNLKIMALADQNVERALETANKIKNNLIKEEVKCQLAGKFLSIDSCKSFELMPENTNPENLVLGLRGILDNCDKLPEEQSKEVIDQVVRRYKSAEAKDFKQISDQKKKIMIHGFAESLTKAYVLSNQMQKAEEEAKKLGSYKHFNLLFDAMQKSSKMRTAILPHLLTTLKNGRIENSTFPFNDFLIKTLKELMNDRPSEVAALIENNQQHLSTYSRWLLWKDLALRFRKINSDLATQYSEKAVQLAEKICAITNLDAKYSHASIKILLWNAILFAHTDSKKSKTFFNRAMLELEQRKEEKKDNEWTLTDKNEIISLHAAYLLHTDPKSAFEKIEEITPNLHPSENDSSLAKLDFFVDTLNKLGTNSF